MPHSVYAESRVRFGAALQMEIAHAYRRKIDYDAVVNLQEKCIQEFDSGLRAQGAECFRSRAVDLEVISAQAAEFTVRRPVLCTVKLDWSEAAAESRALRVECSCASFKKGELCGHVWATILELDRSGRSEEIPGQGALTVLPAHGGVWVRPVPAKPGKTPAPRRTKTSEAKQGQVKTTSIWKSQLFPTSPDEGPSAKPAPETSPQHLVFYIVNQEKSRLTHRLALELRFQEPLKSGEWGAVKSGQFEMFAPTYFENPIDRELFGLILSPLNTSRDKTVEIDPSLMDLLLPRLAQSDRFFLGSQDLGQTSQALRMSDGADWSFEVEVLEDESGYRVDGILRREQERFELKSKDLIVFSAGFVLVAPNRIERIHWDRHFALARLLSQQSIPIPKEDEADFVSSLATNENFPVTHLPASLQWPVQERKPQALVRFAEEGEAYTAKPWMLYGTPMAELDSSREFLFDVDKKVRVKRDLAKEKASLANLSAELRQIFLPGKRLNADALASSAQAFLGEGWQIEIENKRGGLFKDLEGQVRSVNEGFDLVASFDLFGSGGEKVSLGTIAASYAKGERWVNLPGEKIGLLSDDWMKRLDLLLKASTSRTESGALRFERNSMAFLKPLLADVPGLVFDSDIKNLFSNLDGLGAVTQSLEKIEGLKATLRPYQAEGVAWLNTMVASGFGGVLADDMGLGKTMQVIAYLLGRVNALKSQPRPSLVVLPKSLVFNWLAECKKFAPKLRVLDFTGNNRGVLRTHEYDVILTTYHTLRNDLDRFKAIQFDTIILDEAQTIKNSTSLIARAVLQLSVNGTHRFALTGTPIENSLDDLFSILRFASPGLVPARVAEALVSSRDGKASTESLDRLSRALSPFMLRRTKEQVLTELPDKHEQVLFCELEDEQKEVYESLRKHYSSALKKEIAEKGLAKSKIQVFEAILRLRQACSHPGLLDERFLPVSSSKFAVLLEHLAEIQAAGNKALIFSQFTSLLELFKGYLKKEKIAFEYLDGKTGDRAGVVNRFNSDPKTTVFLISLKAGGTGLNLTSASYVFLLDPWWNPAAEAQAIDRAHRMGQKQKVMAYRLIAKDTIEEKILKMQDQKRTLAKAVVNEDPSFMSQLNLEDLSILFE